MENDILTLAALVAAYVGVVKRFGMNEKWTHIAALLFSAIFVLIPESAQSLTIKMSVIGLTASGAYQYVKKRSDGDT
ncbi:hypothetical protein [Paenibacillus rigui]|uniref:Holin n=1 Tax=Paenibacillus rigui TaxID=554312 RepID=A0A229USW3_9BACL|nr:hypothetical protein [Paenibacillus rigui]OXM86450.1 hypothetical protein CF651_09750 [Paenibacillus rigui]